MYTKKTKKHLAFETSERRLAFYRFAYTLLLFGMAAFDQQARDFDFPWLCYFAAVCVILGLDAPKLVNKFFTKK